MQGCEEDMHLEWFLWMRCVRDVCGVGDVPLLQAAEVTLRARRAYLVDGKSEIIYVDESLNLHVTAVLITIQNSMNPILEGMMGTGVILVMLAGNHLSDSGIREELKHR